jgi:pyruvate, water dikinase
MSELPSVTALPGTYPGLDSAERFAPDDDDMMWVLDFHAPRGLTPLGITSIEYTAAQSRAAADAVPMPGSRGLSLRIAASHPYLAPLGVDPEEAAARAARGARRLPAIIAGSRQAWTRQAARLDREFGTLLAEAESIGGMTDARRFLDRALASLADAWRVHFDFMYPLLAGHFGFLERAAALGVPSEQVAALLQGYETAITRTDGAIWELAACADALGVGDALRRRGGADLRRFLGTDAAAPFRRRLAAFLERFGWRTEGIYEVALVPWAEDPQPLLERIRSLLLRETGSRTYADVLAESAAARRRAERDVLSGLTSAEADGFRQALAAARDANFAWWNEDHNASIDLRAHIPLRKAALAVARLAGMQDPEQVVFLFRHELLDLADGRLALPRALERIPERMHLHATWMARRGALPVLAGTAPPRVDDPVLREIFGVTAELIGANDDGERPVELQGIAASAGVARGRARVLRSSRDLALLQHGEVLVCEATTPSWTPGFASAAACVCDQGGRLTHAAIVSREYGVPCVTGTARATRVIASGDLVEVDGGRGRVRVLERASPGRAPA